MTALLIGAAAGGNSSSPAAQKDGKPAQSLASIEGRVMAEAGMYAIPTDPSQPETIVFLFAPESKTNKNRQDTLIKVVYKYLQQEPKLPREFFDYSLRYRLRVTRDRGCDQTLRDVVYVPYRDGSGARVGESLMLFPAKGAPALNPNADLALQCYVLKPGDYQLAK